MLIPLAILAWIRSFLSDITQRVCFGGRLSAEITLIFGVPQGSVLGPLLFLLYTAELFDIISSLGLTGHSYADDTQVYISAPVVESQQAAACLAECIERLDRRMGQNGLKLNAEKTHATDVAWVTASTSQADHLSAPSVDNYVIFNS